MHPDVDQYGLDPISTIVVGTAMFLLTAIALSMRVYVRGFLIKAFGWDDTLLLVAFLLYTGNCTVLVLVGATQAVNGIAEVDASRELAKLAIAGITLWDATDIFSKLSAAIFFLRIVQQTWQKRTIIITMIIYMFVMVTVIFLTVFQCGVPSDILDHEKCLDWDTVMGPISYFSGALTAATDWVFVLTTVSLVIKTKMAPRAKISVVLILSLAAMGSIVSIVRIPFIHGGRIKISQVSKLPRVVILASVEAGVSIVALSLATLRPLVRSWLDAINSKGWPSSNDIEKQAAAHRGTPVLAVPGPSSVAQHNDMVEMEMGKVKEKRVDSHWEGPVIATFSMPSEMSGRYGVLDSVYSADKHERLGS